jgi:hypothetical protein
MTLNNIGVTQHEVELSYLTTGLGWQADYVVELSPNDDKLDLSGWITLTNTSGATYSNAQLQLVAGDVNRVPAQPARPAALAMQATRSVSNSNMAEESFFEYYLYSLQRPTTIADNQVKQVSLLSVAGVIVRKDLVLQGSSYYYQSNAGSTVQKNKVDAYLEFDNKDSSNLGMPLPKGIVRVYKKDSLGHAQFVGEDTLSHTPKDVKARLKMGAAFDVTAERKQLSFIKVENSNKNVQIWETSFEVVLKNSKKEAVTVTVQEPLPGDWQILSESHPHIKTDSHTAVWKVVVPAEGSTTLTYNSRVRL